MITFKEQKQMNAVLEALQAYDEILLTESEEREIDEAVEKFMQYYERDEIETIDEGIFGSIIGGLTGFALGKTLGKILAKVLGVDKGVLYDLLTSRLVGTALGSAVGKKML